jgi:hypothetical protein
VCALRPCEVDCVKCGLSKPQEARSHPKSPHELFPNVTHSLLRERFLLKALVNGGYFVRLYQSSFKPNCICREVVDVEVITPAVGEGTVEADVNTTAFGVPKLAWLATLKNSARN